MSNALKISGVNFSGNALDKVNYVGSIPCTAIALDKNTLSFEKCGDTQEITATVTPENTTDAIIWTSSNDNVATVADGVVTIHGIGTATITATCGEETATATINQTTIKAEGTFVVVEGKAIYVVDQRVQISTNASNNVIGKNYTNNDGRRVVKGIEDGFEAIPVPYGATVAKVATENDTEITMYYAAIVDSADFTPEYYGYIYPKFSSSSMNIKSKKGMAVTYGTAFAFQVSVSETDTPIYVYFE